MARLTLEELRARTLRRQFPALQGRRPEAVLDLFARLGPVQSQVPRSPFVAVSSRLPGVDYAVVNALFATYRLLKASNIRGTVHTSTGADFVRLDAVARQARTPMLRRTLQLDGVAPEEVTDEIERFCAEDWRSRDEIVAHVRDWLQGRGTRLGEGAFTANLLWGHSGLVRSPKNGAWEKRTDSLRRTARGILAGLAEPSAAPDPVTALVGLVRQHLRAYGPLSRADLAFFFGVRLGQVDTALTRLGQEVLHLQSPAGDAWLDTAEPPPAGLADPGLRLLPEFDGLLVGYGGANRARFCAPNQLSRVWARVNGLFSPVVLFDTRLVATWKLLAPGSRTDLQVTMLPGEALLSEDLFEEQAAAVAAVLNLALTDIRVLAPP